MCVGQGVEESHLDKFKSFPQSLEETVKIETTQGDVKKWLAHCNPKPELIMSVYRPSKLVLNPTLKSIVNLYRT